MCIRDSFKDTDLFEQIFSRILQECYKYRLIDPSEVFVAVSYTHLISSFLSPWMDFVYAKLMLNAGISSQWTVAIGLYNMLDKSLINTYFGQFCAGGVLVSIPISVLFVIMQKFYVEGITGGAVKG